MHRFKYDLCVACSAGGHLAEALVSIEKVAVDTCFVTKRDEHVASRIGDRPVFYINDPHTSTLAYLTNAICALGLVLRIRPKVVLSTGSGIAIPFCLLAKISGSKIIFIETGARVVTPSRTGQFMYKYADEFYIQWPALRQYYPKAKYHGRLL